MSCLNALSIVIPIGPHDQSWSKLLAKLVDLGPHPEIILSACESQPKGLQLPENAIWLNLAQGRAKQLNAGGNIATRKFLWFLHADTYLTTTVDHVLKQFIQDDIQQFGYFKLKFADDGPTLTCLNAWAANFRSTLFGLPFGDQGFLIHKTVFDDANGFDETLKLGEDLDFVVRIKAAGIELQELSAELITSARRYRQHGWLLTTIRHLSLTWYLTRQAKQRLRLA